MACQVSRDDNGTTYHVPESKPVVSPGGHTFPGSDAVDIWWGRRFKEAQDETLLLRQENGKTVDVITLTLGQVYDVIHALGWAVMRP